MFSKTKKNDILNQLPLNQQIVFVEIQNIMKRKNTLVMSQEEIFAGYYSLCQKIIRQHTDKQVFNQIIDVLESYNFVSVDQGSKRKVKSFNLKSIGGSSQAKQLKILISREEIRSTLIDNPSLRPYL